MLVCLTLHNGVPFVKTPLRETHQKLSSDGLLGLALIDRVMSAETGTCAEARPTHGGHVLFGGSIKGLHGQ